MCQPHSGQSFDRSFDRDMAANLTSICWITDLVSHETSGVHDMMWRRDGDYLCELGGEDYRDKVFEYIDKEDSPRPVTYQLDLLRRVGFGHVELLHKNSCFAAYGAIKR